MVGGLGIDDDLLVSQTPFALQVEITSRCNPKCKVCPLTTGTTSSGLDGGHISEEIWAQLLPLGKRAKQVFVAALGEPLANPRCLELLRELDAHGVRTTLVTNGVALTPSIAAALAELEHLAHINMSIDSPDPVTYCQVRGGSLNRSLRGLGNLMAVSPDRSVYRSPLGLWH